MLALVEQIEHADYAERVFASTSHVRLQISYLPEFDPDKEALSVDLNHETGEFEFDSTSDGGGHARQMKHSAYLIASYNERNGFPCVSLD